MSKQQPQQKQEQEYPELHRINTHITQSTWLHVEDSLHIGKLRLFAGKYRRGEGAQETLAHWLDADAARSLFHDLSWGKTVDFTEFKGSANSGQVVSRVLRVNTSGDKVYFELRQGPGKVTETGAVQPVGKPTAQVNVMFKKEQARMMSYAVLEYMQAVAVARIMLGDVPLHPSPNGHPGATQPAGPPDPPAPDPEPARKKDVDIDEINDTLF